MKCFYATALTSKRDRPLAPGRFVRDYNAERPHLAPGGLTPNQRLAEPSTTS